MGMGVRVGVGWGGKGNRMKGIKIRSPAVQKPTGFSG